MFRDLKEYQDITKIYQDSVHISEEERIITQIIREENFTQEELDYVIENFDEIYDNEVLTEEFFDEMEGEYLEEMAAVKKAAETVVKKVAPKVAKKVTKTAKKVVDTAKNVQPEIPGIRDTAKTVKPVVKKTVQKVGNTSKKVLPKAVGAVPAAGAVGAGVGIAKSGKGLLKKGLNVAKSAVSKLKSGVKKVVTNPTVRKVVSRAVPGLALAGGLAVGAKKLLDKRNKAKKDDAIDKQVDKYVQDRKNPDGIRKIDPKQFDSRGQKPDKPKPQTEVDKIAATPRSEIKKSGRTAMIKKNIDRFGKDRVQHLQDKNKDFKLMKKGTMSKDDFIKKYPKSITAQKAKGLRDHTEWDAYDMVLEYLFSTEQVTSLEEANYVMMEMDHQTIGEIVKEVKVALNEDV